MNDETVNKRNAKNWVHQTVAHIMILQVESANENKIIVKALAVLSVTCMGPFIFARITHRAAASAPGTPTTSATLRQA